MARSKRSTPLFGALAALVVLLVLVDGRLFRTLREPGALERESTISTAVEQDADGVDPLLPRPAGRAPVAVALEEHVVPDEVPPAEERPGIEVEFRVQGLGGAAEAMLELWHPAMPDPPVLYHTDDDGILSLVLEPGEIHYSAWTEMRSSTRLHDVLLPEDERRVIPIELLPCGFVEGRVVEARGGRPIEGARITIAVLHKRREVLANGEGWYRLGVPIDAIGRGIQCRADGYAEDAAMLRFSEDGWDLERGATPDPASGSWSTQGVGVARVDFELLPEGILVGRVVAVDRSPIAGAEVRAHGYYWADEHAASPDDGAGTTEPDGTFAITGLLPDITHHVRVGMAGFATARVAVPPSGSATRDLGTIALAPEAILDGVLLDARGAPVEGLEMRLEPPGDRRDAMHDATGPFPRDADFGGSDADRVDTAADGTFRFTGLACGAWMLVVRSDWRRIHEVELELAPAERRKLVVELPETCPEIQGVVLTAAGPVRGACVELAFKNERATVSDDQGRFQFRGLGYPTATYQLQAWWNDEAGRRWTSPVVEARAGDAPVRLELAPP